MARRIALFLLALASFSFAQEELLANFAADSTSIDSLTSADTVAAVLQGSVEDSLVLQVDSIASENVADSVARNLEPVADSAESVIDSVKQSANSVVATVEEQKNVVAQATKTVLYLEGSKHSAYFDLGVLYAFETYGVRVDSIVGSSYGAWVGSLWKSGYSLDEIQRVLRHPDVERFLLNENEVAKTNFLPLADSGVAAIRNKLVLGFDSTGKVHSRTLPLHMDTLQIAKQRFRLRIEESLYRRKMPINVSVVTCDGSLKNGVDAVLSTMPFEGNMFGAGCQIPLPHEGDFNNALIVTPFPLREPATENSNEKIAHAAAARELEFYKESAIVIRPLQELPNTPEAWIQSGFTETEKKLSALASAQELKPYTTLKDSVKPWFRYVATPDSIPSELQLHLMSYWNENDTGMVAIEKFLERISESEVYDSVELKLQPNGNVLMRALAPLQMDVRAGGFGNNIFGAFAFADARIRYVNQFEYELGSSVFYGMGGYGATPELKLLRLLEGSFNFSIRYEFLKLRPLTSYLKTESTINKIYEERRGDLRLVFDFLPNANQRVSLSALVGDREYEMHEYISKTKIKAKPLEPKLEYEYKVPKFEKWFGDNGYDVIAAVGLESVGASFGYGESVPIFWKFAADASGNVSPVRFFTVGGGAAFGSNIYREEGKDYPPSFGFAPVDMTIRQGIAATPWSTEWYKSEYRSHQYGLLRANMGLHMGPFGAWIFGAFVKDFENANLEFSDNRIVLEPALRFAYKSLVLYAGMNRTVNVGDFSDLGSFEDYNYFIRVGNFDF